MKYVTAIVLAAGQGLRLSRANSFTVRNGTKPLVKIGSVPIIINCLKTLDRHPDIRDIIVVANTLNKEEIIGNLKKYRIRKIRAVVLGGKRRQDSVDKGLKAVSKEADWVLIHDGVRPFINKELISSVIKEAKKAGAAIVGVPVKATIKKLKTQSLKLKTKFVVEKTLNRDNLWEIQTPQVFKKDLILKAYKRFGNINVTDDAMLVEKMGIKPRVVLGSYNNIKITTPEDLVIAKAIAKI